jgi:hypothetical protein
VRKVRKCSRSGDENIFSRKKKKIIKKEYDKENLQPVIRCSICNGEQIAGFRNRQTGKFEETMLIKSDIDLMEFKEMYGVSEIRKEY